MNSIAVTPPTNKWLCIGVTPPEIMHNLHARYSGEITRATIDKLADMMEVKAGSRYTTLLRAPALFDKLTDAFPNGFTLDNATHLLGKSRQQFAEWRTSLNSYSQLILYTKQPVGGMNGGFHGRYSIVDGWEDKLLMIIREYIAKSPKYFTLLDSLK